MTEHEAISFHKGQADGQSFGRSFVALSVSRPCSIPDERIAAVVRGKVHARGWSLPYYDEGYRLGLRLAGVEVGASWGEHLDRLRALWLQDAKDEIAAEEGRGDSKIDDSHLGAAWIWPNGSRYVEASRRVNYDGQLLAVLFAPEDDPSLRAWWSLESLMADGIRVERPS